MSPPAPGDLTLSCVKPVSRPHFGGFLGSAGYKRYESFPKELCELNIFAICILNKLNGLNMLVTLFSWLLFIC